MSTEMFHQFWRCNIHTESECLLQEFMSCAMKN